MQSLLFSRISLQVAARCAREPLQAAARCARPKPQPQNREAQFQNCRAQPRNAEAQANVSPWRKTIKRNLGGSLRASWNIFSLKNRSPKSDHFPLTKTLILAIFRSQLANPSFEDLSGPGLAISRPGFAVEKLPRETFGANPRSRAFCKAWSLPWWPA